LKLNAIISFDPKRNSRGSVMIRALALLTAIAIAAPASAATYAGKPVAPAAEAKFVGRDIVWTLAGGSYQGSTSESRPLVLCQSLAKRAGQLASFTVNGRALPEADLAKCNAAAPAASAPALAQAE
jgi:hypothetical protein